MFLPIMLIVRPLFLLVVLGLLTGPRDALGQSAENVLLVINTDSPASVEVGEYYAAKRGLPVNNVVRLSAPTTEAIARPAYESSLETPLAVYLSRHRLQDQILYIVLTKGVPLRVVGTGGRDGTGASVDSELTLLYRKLLGHVRPTPGSLENPLFLGERAVSTAKPFTRLESDLYLVTRLDGFTVSDVKALVDRGLTPARGGAILLDQKATLIDRGGDQWLEEAATRLQSVAGAPAVVLEKSKDVATAAGALAGYFSWGSNDPSNQLRRTGLSFSPGAIGGTFVSTDARTFIEPPATWKPSRPTGGPSYRGSFQSLVGDLIRDGITGVAGQVEEPYLDGLVRPQILFPAYASGFNLAESFYAALPYLSWKTVVIGDPLCRPYEGKVLSRAELMRDLDSDTELPGVFSDRRVEAMSAGGLNRTAVKLLLKKEARLARGEEIDVEAMLEEATTLESRLIPAHYELAQIFDARKDHAAAIDRYRRILSVTPDDAVALNNLAYAIAVHTGAPKDALPHAERAYRLSRQSAEITDTLGWIHHLLGDDLRAAAYLEQALRLLPGHPDILLHNAAVHAALKDYPRARAELNAAQALGAAIREREDFKALRALLLGP